MAVRRWNGNQVPAYTGRISSRCNVVRRFPAAMVIVALQ